MSAVISYPQESIDRITLASLLTPMQFKTVLLVACGLKKCEIAELLGTRERVIENALRDIYDRTGCANSEVPACPRRRVIVTGWVIARSGRSA